MDPSHQLIIAPKEGERYGRRIDCYADREESVVADLRDPETDHRLIPVYALDHGNIEDGSIPVAWIDDDTGEVDLADGIDGKIETTQVID